VERFWFMALEGLVAPGRGVPRRAP